jgi:hypothetical protein
MLQSFHAHVPEELALKLLHYAFQALQQIQPCRSDARSDHTTVFQFPAALDQSPAFQTIQQARDVGISVDHPVSNFAARQPFRSCTPQDSQSVVLRGREPVPFEHLGGAPL